MFSFIKVVSVNCKKISTTILLVWLVLSLSAGFALSADGSANNQYIQSTFSTKIGLRNGMLHLSFSSQERALKLDFAFESKEFHQTISSVEDLGILVKVEGSLVDLSIRFLGVQEAWDPTSELDEAYQTRASFKKDPGWKIVIVEKPEKKLI